MEAPKGFGLNQEIEAAIRQEMEGSQPAAAVPQAAEPATPRNEVRQAPTSDDLAPRFAKLNAASAKLQQERQQFKMEMEQRKADFEELQRLREARARAKEDPVTWAKLAGFEQPDEYAVTLVDKGAMTPDRRRIIEQEKELRELKSWREQQETERREAAQQAQQRQMLDQIAQFGKSEENAERFDLVNRLGVHHLVLEEIKAHWQRTFDPSVEQGEVLPIDQAYAAVEDRLDKELSPLLESPKYRSRFASAPAEASSAPASTLAPRHSKGTTITGKMHGSVSQPRELSEDERMEAAFKLMFGE